ncbi:isopeptide-forming domain-containing fimbrial protein [Bifidobacterium sp. ESL0682]|uniref:isopeptide-forming domain-containing fimbrial protein n=1 Tax=Bifidobacterium sp. ESL0682 TaxID=2983212 RepID=UPI0023F7C8DD|nr:isopeptide-forming domain-containing fimbrial protein [Bifidobacterium sp. ESL0682]WEV42074.1 isopeptide-forming domain-containing fimbrial protein [Bifidobacterium sp. ESL0682]
MSNNKLRPLAAAVISAATLLAFAPFGVANAANASIDMSKAGATTITINGDKNTMKGHKFAAVKVGDYQNAAYDSAHAGVLTGVSVSTDAQVKEAATAALAAAKGDRNITPTTADSAYVGNPVGEVASKWLGYGTGEDGTSNTATAVAPDKHGWNGALRDFVTELAKSQTANASDKTFSQLFAGQTTYDATATTGDDYNAVVNVSEPGLYVVEDLTAQTVADSAALKNSIPMLVGTGISLNDGTNYNMLGSMALGTISMKNDTPSVTKTLDSTADNSDTSIGGKLHYKLTSTVPLTTGFDHYVFTMVDHPGKGLTFNDPSSLKVTVGGTPLAATDYTVKHAEDADGNTTYIVIDFSSSVRSMKYQDSIVVTYALGINNNAESGKPMKNGVTLAYSNDSNKQPTTDAPTTDANGNVINCVPTTSTCPNGSVTNNADQDGANSPSTANAYFRHFNVINQKKADGAGLSGATFQLFKKGDATPIKFLKTGDGMYKKSALQSDTNATANLVVNDGAAAQDGDTPVSAGQLQIDGLADGHYTLKETAAAPGFSGTFLPSTEVQVGQGTNPSDSAFANTKDALYNLIDAKGTVAAGSTAASLVPVAMTSAGAVVVNNINSISQLPLTGGAGVILMLLVVVALAMIAAALIFARRKIND